MNRLVLSRSSALKLASTQFPRMFSQNSNLSRKAVIFDMGGVLIESPVQAFRLYEEKHRIPDNSITSLVFEGENSGIYSSISKPSCARPSPFVGKVSNTGRHLGGARGALPPNILEDNSLLF